MSVSRECVIAEMGPEEFYLIMASREYGTIEDEFTTCDGPFETEAEADDYITGNYANPGSLRFTKELTPRMIELISTARYPRRRRI